MESIQPELARIIGEIWTSHRMKRMLTEICSFGGRLAGSEGERNTRDFILHKVENAGLTEYWTWQFDYLGWMRGTCSLRFFDEGSEVLVPAISLLGSPSTPPHGLYGELIDLGFGTERDFLHAAEQIDGRIVMVSSGSPANEAPVHRRAKYGWAVRHGAAGFLQWNHQPGGTSLTGSLRLNRIAEIPGLSIGHEHGMEIRRRLDSAPGRVRADIANQSRKAQAANIFVDIPGATEDIVLLGAHYDGHDISPSAQDNGSGLATVLELARLLAPLQGKLRRTIRIAFWTVEEWALVGSRKYVASLTEDELRRYSLVVNLDTTTGLGPKSWVVNGMEAHTPFIRQAGEGAGYDWSVREDVLTNSDHFSFLLRGVPAVWLQGTVSSETTPRRFVLSENDTLDKVCFREMKESAMVTAQLILRAADHPGKIAPHCSIDEVQTILRSRGLQPALEAQEDWPSLWSSRSLQSPNPDV